MWYVYRDSSYRKYLTTFDITKRNAVNPSAILALARATFKASLSEDFE